MNTANEHISKIKRAYAASGGTHADHIDAFTNYVESRMEIQEQREKELIADEIGRQLSSTKASVEVDKVSLQNVKKAVMDLFAYFNSKR